jgi:hypothetical protein
MQNDPWITIRKLATELSVFKRSVHNITDALRYSKVCARWLPQSIMKYHKTVQKEVHSEANGKIFLSWIITWDDEWIHHFQPQTKRQSVEWHCPTS